MSNYPTPSYGGSYQNHDQNNNAPYLPPTYPNQYMQQENNGPVAHAQGNVGSNYDAYGYNSVIPGFNPAAVPSVSPVPIFQGWSQDPLPLPPYTAAPPNPTSYPGYSSNPQQPQYYPSFSQTGYQQPPPVAPRAFDHRELSEGEFDEGAARAANTPPTGYGVSQYHGNEGVSRGDDMNRTVYSEPQGHNSRQSPFAGISYNSPIPEAPASARRGSDSYSPYISPRILHSNGPKVNHYQGQNAQSKIGEDASGSIKLENGRPQNGTSSNVQSKSVANGNTARAMSSSVQDPPSNVSTGSNARSIAESKRAAQGAILDLWPHVQYQAYIDEGYMESTINRLFDAANIPRSSTRASHVRASQHHRGMSPGNFSPPRHQHVPPAISNGISNTVASKMGRTESNLVNGSKVRSQAPPQNQLPTKIATAPSLPEPPTAPNEKELKLQAKIEALRKSREDRAQKAAAKKEVKDVTAPAKVPVTLPEKPKPSEQIEKSASTSRSSISPTGIQTPPVQLPNPVPNPTPLSQPTLNPEAHLPKSQALPTPNIPGLFLTSSATSPAPSTSSQGPAFAPTPSSSRKRPVAADFDDPVPPTMLVKRPFGHSRNDETLVINVSEDEESDDEDVAMDLDDSEANQDSPVQPARRLSDHRAPAVQNLPQLPNFPKYNFSSSSPSAANTPPIPLTASRPAPTRPADLQRKESQIEELKRKIAQAEARSRARQTPSGTRTPIANQAADNSKTIDVSEASKVGLVSVAIPAMATEQPSTPPVPTESFKAAVIEQDEDDGELLQKEEMARNEVSLRASEFEKHQKKLEELKAEFARMESTAKEVADKLQEAKERDRQLQEAKELRLKRQSQIAQEAFKAGVSIPLPSSPAVASRVETSVPRSSSVGIASPPIIPGSAHSDPANGVSVHTESPTHLHSPTAGEESQVPVSTGTVNPSSPIIHSVSLEESEESQLLTGNGVGHKTASAELEISEGGMDIDMNLQPANDVASNDHALEAALQEAVRADADAHYPNAHSPDEGELDIEMSYAPDPAELAPESPAVEEDNTAYSPPQELALQIGLGEEEEDDYEPPEATPPAISPPFSPAPPDEGGLVLVDEMMLDDVPLISGDVGRELIDEEDDQSALPTLNGSAPVPEVPKEVSTVRFFTPYVSPLRQFRAYRFHPQFEAEVAGGLRSLTFSNDIDPNAELCRFELAGGICNDDTCYCLHFKDIGLKDSLILAYLGSPAQFAGPRTAEFKEGLTSVLLKLREDKIRDFHIIAAEILAYRAKFLGDDSKVLPLEGVTI